MAAISLIQLAATALLLPGNNLNRYEFMTMSYL